MTPTLEAVIVVLLAAGVSALMSGLCWNSRGWKQGFRDGMNAERARREIEERAQQQPVEPDGLPRKRMRVEKGGAA